MKSESLFTTKDRTLIIKLKQELDHHNAEYIRKKTDSIIEQKVIKNIVFDFSNVEFMDSSGIGVIMGRYKKITFNKGMIYVINVNSKLDTIIRMSGLYRLVKKCVSLDEALNCIEIHNN